MQKKNSSRPDSVSVPDTRLCRENLLLSIANDFISMSFIMIDDGISRSLELLCRDIGADAAFIFFLDDTKSRIDRMYHYCEDRSDPLFRITDRMPVTAEEHFLNLLSVNTNVKIESEKDFPPEKKRGFYTGDEFRPLLVLPVMHGGKLRGSLGVCGKQGIARTWENDVARTLAVFSDIAYHAFTRKKREELLYLKEPDENTPPEEPRHIAFIISGTECNEPVILEYSAGAESVFGYGREELIGKPVSQIYLPESSSIFQSQESAQPGIEDNTGEVSGGEGLFRKKSGEPFTALYSIYSLSDDKGRPNYILQISTGPVNREKIEKALLAAEQEKALILSSVSELLIYVDTHLAIKWANKAACEQLGFECGEIAGRYCYEIWMGKKTPCRKCPVTEALATGKNIEREMKTKDGRMWLSRAYPVKSQSGIIIGAVEVIQDITLIKQTEEQLRLMQFSIDHSAVATYWVDADARMVYANDIACDVLGYTRDELMSLKVHDIDPNFPPEVWPAHWNDVRTKKAFSIFTDHRRKDGSVYPVEVMINYVNFEGREYNFAFALDLTEKQKAAEERTKLEEQLLQARRMGALGRLAQGVAHDFNNILTGMQGYIHFIKHNLGRDNPLQHDVNEIKKSIERAAGLTEQLLAFNRKQESAPHIFDINTKIDEAYTMLLRIIGEDVGLIVNRKIKHGNIRFDPHQMDQLLVNLAVIIRDRIPAGAKLAIETEPGNIPAAVSAAPDTGEGEYIALRMSDSVSIAGRQGLGGNPVPGTNDNSISTDVTEEADRRIRLSSIYNLLHQNNCHINILPGTDTGVIIEVFIPLINNPEQKNEEVLDQYKNLPRGNETILLVEDEEMVRTFTKRFLTYQGYKVIDASRSREAIQFCRSYNRRIHLLLTDVVMPELSGRELFEQLKNIIPDIKVLYMSGYSGDIIAIHGIHDDDPNFIYKPFSIENLTQKIRSILDEEDR